MNRPRLATLAGILICLFSPPVDAADSAQDQKLNQIMQGLQQNMFDIAGGLFAGDMQKVSEAAKNIAYHPPVSAAQAQRLSAQLGPQMTDYARLDRQVHGQALGVQAAADSKDHKRVASEFSTLLDGCLACHDQYRERVSRILNSGD